MHIHSIKLENIRSYLNENINFPEGSTLLSGDIGSGKSTILLAMEFALFGMQRGEGDALLRNGKHEGAVELVFSIGGKEYSIKRKLRRSGSVSQETGYILIDGVKKEGSAQELKAWVIELLGYPKEALTKKSLIYRYTVYTPQESMKQILLDDKEFRIDTLRKVFGIDKYRLIRENAEIYAKELRDIQRELKAKTEGLEEKKKQKELLGKEAEGIEIEIKLIEPEITAAKTAYENACCMQREGEEKISQLNKMKQKMAALESEIKSKEGYCVQSAGEMEKLEKYISMLEQEISKQEIAGTAGLLKSANEELSVQERRLFSVVKKLNEPATLKNHSLALLKKITSMNNCPTCLQAVRDEHKENIRKREEGIIERQELLIKKYEGEHDEVSRRVALLKKNIEELREKEKRNAIIKARAENLEIQKKRRDDIIKQQKLLKESLESLNMQKTRLIEEIVSRRGIEQEHSNIVKLVEKLAEKKHKIEVEMEKLLTEKRAVKRMIDAVENDIARMLECHEKIRKISSYEEWLSELFTGLMTNIEKHVMAKLYHEFNELFQQWFKVLIEDEAITVQLDEEFGPQVNQNGYQISIENMSGGEKTSCALAYRLSLNKVINDLIGTIKTKDFIILDEPTDGFSSEQLDKVRDVLEQIGIKQIIIVSHEKKIESFVDNVIYVTKEEHVSRVS